MTSTQSGLLLVSDIDGTLMNFPAPIPQRNLDALRRFTDAGGRFAVATGRSLPSARPYVELLPVNAPCILYNGCALYDFAKEQMLGARFLPDSFRSHAKRIVQQFPEYGFVLMTEQVMYSISAMRYVQKYLSREQMKIVESDIDTLEGPFLKMIIALPPSEVTRVENFVNAQGWSDVAFFRSGQPYLEMLPIGSDKGNALIDLAGLLCIPMKDTVAIGDYYNDAGMLRAAGFGATVAEAPDALKYISQRVCGACDSGAIADLIEYLETRQFA